MTSDLVVSAPGWWIENIRISSDDFTAVGETGPGTNTFAITGRAPGTYTYRVAALFNNPISGEPVVTGPYSNPRCVTVLPGPAPASVVSRKTHGSAGPHDVPLPLTGNPGVECRTGGAGGEHQVVFFFPSSVTVQGATVSRGEGTATSVTPSGATIVVNLSGVSDVQTIEVTLTGVNDAGNVSAPMDVLLGDVTANRVVNAADVGETKGVAQTSPGVTGANFRADVNLNGIVNAADVSLVKAQSGNGLQ
jgi:hypothetical protein